MRVLAGLLRVGIGLDRTYRRAVQQVHTSVDDGSITIDVEVAEGVDVDIELFTARRSAGLLEEALERRVDFRVVVNGTSRRQSSHPVHSSEGPLLQD